MLRGENRGKWRPAAAGNRTQDTWLVQPVLYHWATTTGQSPAPTILCMYCTGETEVPQLHTRQPLRHFSLTWGTSVSPVQYIWMIVGAGGCPVVVAQWQSTACTSQVSWVLTLLYFRLLTSEFLFIPTRGKSSKHHDIICFANKYAVRLKL